MRLIIISLLLIGCVGCGSDQKRIIEVLIQDISDNDSIASVNKEDVIQHYLNDIDKWGSYSFSYMSLADVNFRTRFEYSIEAEESIFSVEEDRDLTIQEFEENLLAIDYQDEGAFSNTVILPPLIQTIKELSLNTNDSISIYLVSDLESNNPLFNLYSDKALLKELSENPAAIEHKVQSFFGDLKSAPNVHLILVNQPTIETNLFYSAIVKVYTNAFKTIGIKVSTRGAF